MGNVGVKVWANVKRLKRLRYLVELRGHPLRQLLEFIWFVGVFPVADERFPGRLRGCFRDNQQQRHDNKKLNAIALFFHRWKVGQGPL